MLHVNNSKLSLCVACARRCRSSRLAGWWTQKELSEKMEDQGGGETQGVADPPKTTLAYVFHLLTTPMKSFLSRGKLPWKISLVSIFVTTQTVRRPGNETTSRGQFLDNNSATYMGTKIYNREWKFIPGLPDGFVSNQKYQFGQILEGLTLENVDIFNGHLEYFTDIWDILWPFGIFAFTWYIFFGFGIMYQ
jgi:hypothetical protein